MRTATIAIAISFLSQAAVAQPHPTEMPFEFRGAVLGMTLEGFEALPPLSDARLTKLGDDLKILANDLLFECKPSSTGIEAKLGVTECKRAGDNPFTSTGGFEYTDISYDFIDSKDGHKRLFRITVFTGRDKLDQAKRGLVEKWGRGKETTSTATNGLGQPLPSINIVWSRSSGMIALVSPCLTVNNICVSYLDNALSKIFDAAAEKINGAAGSRF